MTNTTGTAQKSTKGRDYSAPREINENTKARRAWLAEKLASVLAEPDTDQTKTKIVGIGSYQRVSEWKLVTVEGRERFRGVCQLCGHLQVVDGDRIVLHGYNRPGHGYIVGECPAAKEQPLNSSDVITRKYLAQFAGELPAAIEAETIAERDMKAAVSTRDASDEPRYINKPWLGKKPTAAERAEYEKEMAAFAVEYPHTFAVMGATAIWSAARGRRQWLADMVTHLEGLLAAGILGSPLTREVVA